MLQDRRRHPRHLITPHLYVGLNNATSGGILADVSEGGMALELLGPNPASDDVRLDLSLSGRGVPFQTKAQVTWTKESEHRVGLKFVDLTESSLLQVKKWLANKPARPQFEQNDVIQDSAKGGPAAQNPLQQFDEIRSQAATAERLTNEFGPLISGSKALRGPTLNPGLQFKSKEIVTPDRQKEAPDTAGSPDDGTKLIPDLGAEKSDTQEVAAEAKAVYPESIKVGLQRENEGPTIDASETQAPEPIGSPAVAPDLDDRVLQEIKELLAIKYPVLERETVPEAPRDVVETKQGEPEDTDAKVVRGAILSRGPQSEGEAPVANAFDTQVPRALGSPAVAPDHEDRVLQEIKELLAIKYPVLKPETIAEPPGLRAMDVKTNQGEGQDADAKAVHVPIPSPGLQDGRKEPVTNAREMLAPETAMSPAVAPAHGARVLPAIKESLVKKSAAEELQQKVPIAARVKNEGLVQHSARPLEKIGESAALRTMEGTKTKALEAEMAKAKAVRVAIPSPARPTERKELVANARQTQPPKNPTVPPYQGDRLLQGIKKSLPNKSPSAGVRQNVLTTSRGSLPKLMEKAKRAVLRAVSATEGTEESAAALVVPGFGRRSDRKPVTNARETQASEILRVFAFAKKEAKRLVRPTKQWFVSKRTTAELGRKVLIQSPTKGGTLIEHPVPQLEKIVESAALFERSKKTTADVGVTEPKAIAFETSNPRRLRDRNDVLTNAREKTALEASMSPTVALDHSDRLLSKSKDSLAKESATGMDQNSLIQEPPKSSGSERYPAQRIEEIRLADFRAVKATETSPVKAEGANAKVPRVAGVGHNPISEPATNVPGKQLPERWDRWTDATAAHNEVRETKSIPARPRPDTIGVTQTKAVGSAIEANVMEAKAVHFVAPRAGPALEEKRLETSPKKVDLPDVAEKFTPSMQSGDDLQRALRKSLGQLQDATVAKQNAEPDPADRDALYKWVLAAAVAFILILALAAARWIYTSTAFDNISSASDLRDAMVNLFGSSGSVPPHESIHNDKSKAYPAAARASRKDMQKPKNGKAPVSDTSAPGSNEKSPRLEVMDAQNGRRRVPHMGSTVTVPSNQSPPAQTTHISGSQPASPLVTQEQIVRMVGHVSLQPAADVPTEMVLPEYPVEALQKNEEGRVTLYATISRDGTLQNIRAVGGSSVLADSALKAVKTWRYQPHTENGRPVETETRITIDFKK